MPKISLLVKTDYVDATTTYVGTTKKGNSDGDLVWKILKITTSSSDVTVETTTDPVEGKADWTNRASHTYG